VTGGQFHFRLRNRKEFWRKKSAALERRRSTNETEECPLEYGNTDPVRRKINSKNYIYIYLFIYKTRHGLGNRKGKSPIMGRFFKTAIKKENVVKLFKTQT
jgi:hypothetical protein